VIASTFNRLCDLVFAFQDHLDTPYTVSGAKISRDSLANITVIWSKIDALTGGRCITDVVDDLTVLAFSVPFTGYHDCDQVGRSSYASKLTNWESLGSRIDDIKLVLHDTTLSSEEAYYMLKDESRRLLRELELFGEQFAHIVHSRIALGLDPATPVGSY
jgi:hypothetical protein